MKIDSCSICVREISSLKPIRCCIKFVPASHAFARWQLYFSSSERWHCSSHPVSSLHTVEDIARPTARTRDETLWQATVGGRAIKLSGRFVERQSCVSEGPARSVAWRPLWCRAWRTVTSQWNLIVGTASVHARLQCVPYCCNGVTSLEFNIDRERCRLKY